MSSEKKGNKKIKARKEKLRVEVKMDGFEISIKPMGTIEGFVGKKRVYKKKIKMCR